jgi:hypothetical protein
MKKKALLLAIWTCASMLLISCNAQQDIENQEAANTSTISTRTLSADEPSISNPNLQNDWENVDVIKLNGGGEIDAPWVVKEGNSMNIPLNYRTDIKSEDGWIMLSHTLLNQSSLEPNYILLYNKYSGIVKGFYYNRENIKNQSFLWALESQNPTSVFLSNDRVQEPIDSCNTYVTSSNIVENSQFNYGQLNQGWNCFSFELPYGTINNAPILSIKGYNNENSSLNLSGTYSGEVIIPVTSEEPSGLKSIVTSLHAVAGLAAAIFPQLSVVPIAISAASSILGPTSLYKSKTNTSNIRATSSGTMKLDGTSFTLFGGASTSINNIDIKRLNGNSEVGVWNLKKLPTMTINKYARALQKNTPIIGDDDKTKQITVYRLIDLSPSIDKSYVEINPALLPLIKDYEVSTDFFFSKGLYSGLPAIDYMQFGTDWYGVKIPNKRIEISGTYVPCQYQNRDNLPFVPYLSYIDKFPETFINVQVEIEFNNGYRLNSSRVYKLDGKLIDNTKDVLSSSDGYVILL